MKILTVLTVMLSIHIQGTAQVETSIQYQLKDTSIVIYKLGQGKRYGWSNNYEAAIENYNEANKIALDLFGPYNRYTRDYWIEMGRIKFKRNLPLEAIKAFEKAYNISDKLEDIEKKKGQLYNMAVVYYNIGDYKAAIEKLQEAIKFAFENQIQNTLFDTYNILGMVYLDSGDIELAIQYFKKALSLKEDNNLKTEQLGNVYNSLGSCYDDDLDKKTTYLEKALFYWEKPNTRLQFRASLYGNLGFCYCEKGQFDLGESYLKKAETLSKKVGLKNNQSIAILYNSMGLCRKLQKDYTKAIDLQKKAILTFSEDPTSKHPILAQFYKNLGQTYFEAGNQANAIRTIKKSFYPLNYDSDKDLASVLSLPVLINNLAYAAFLHREIFHSTSNKENLTLSRNFYKEAITVIDTQFYKISRDSRINLSTLATPIYGGAIATNFLLYELTKDSLYVKEAFSFAEKSKAIILLNAINQTKAVQFFGISDSLIQNVDRLSALKNYYKKQYQEKIKKQRLETDKDLLSLSNKILAVNQQYQQLQEKIAKKHPAYFQATRNLGHTNISDIQSSVLKSNQTLLNYSIYDNDIYIFCVQKNDYNFFRIEGDSSLSKEVENLVKNGIAAFHTSPENQRTDSLASWSFTNYTKAAQNLYQKLIAPVKKQLTKQVIIIPDDVLGYIPFEVLLTKVPLRSNIFRVYPFLIKEHQISYCYSATLLHQMQNKKHQAPPEKKLLGFAPFYNGSIDTLIYQVTNISLSTDFQLQDSLTTLEESGPEVSIALGLIGGDGWLDENATIDTFMRYANQYQLIHLATHGKADDQVGDYAYVTFRANDSTNQFTKLYARDLYNMRLNADMVLLSACETGIGKLQKGEGIISLARAFAFAGAKSIFTTLWKVNDRKTKEIIISFYKYLKKNKPKDEALHLAKLDYLKNNDTASHPFFWAGMIGIGDMKSLD